MHDLSSRPVDVSRFARLHEYTASVDPVRSGIQPPMPLRRFDRELIAAPHTQLVPLDLSDALGCAAPATSPALCAHFLRIGMDDTLAITAAAASELYYVLAGKGEVHWRDTRFDFAMGDFFTLPHGPRALHSRGGAVLYYVNDAPLLTHLGARPDATDRTPVLYPAGRSPAELVAVRARASSRTANRVSVIVADDRHDRTRSATSILWAMLGVLPRGAVQKAHRHQSVALDLIVDCAPGVYSLVGDEVDAAGNVVGGQRVDWQSGGVFTTPPGLWHSHHNESDGDAHLVPVQDAGLHTHLRTLDIRFQV